MTWTETTLRKGTKTPKICRDMFITDSRGVWSFNEVKNGRLKKRVEISRDEAMEYIANESLHCVSSTIFNNCFTYRTAKSTQLIDEILAR